MRRLSIRNSLTLSLLALVLLLSAAIFATTNALVLRGGEDVGALLRYLAIYVPGYQVTFLGSCIGALAFFLGGWVAGKLIGAIYNVAVARAEG